jgi:beta-galactosidase
MGTRYPPACLRVQQQAGVKQAQGAKPLQINRRNLVKLGALAGVGSRLPEAVGSDVPSAAAANSHVAPKLLEAPDSLVLRRRDCLDDGWRFAFGNLWEPARDFDFGEPSRLGTLSKSSKLLPVSEWSFDDANWEAVNVPHDWAVALPIVHDPALVMHGSRPVARTYPETSVGWYRRRFSIAAGERGSRIVLEFDGIFRASQFFVNGYHLDQHSSGYTPFRLDVTDYVLYGGDNILTVRVDASQQEGWFYEGAGIYRHVWLTRTAATHLEIDGVWVRSSLEHGGAQLQMGAEVANESQTAAEVRVQHRVLDAEGRVVAQAETAPHTLEPGARHTQMTAAARLPSPELWSIDAPYRYRLQTTLFANDKPVDRLQQHFGVRTMQFDAKEGFLLNGKRVPIQGTCNHQDYAGVGVAVPDFVQTLRIERLKELGCNAFRTHHAMTVELLDACDRLGMLVLAENRWESSTPEGLEQLSTMVRRDRNRACLFLWSLANEEPGQGTETGALILASMKRCVRALDPTRPVTAAMNGDFGKGFSAVVDVQGFNYNLDDIDAFRKTNPSQPCIGTEVASTLFTRGVYHDDAKLGLVNAYDTYVPKWGETAEQWMQFYAARPWLSGGFVWTGYDYRGEPQPFLDVSISSQFGILDTCGFAKDTAFYYQAWWRPEPLLHLLPHWNWKPGEVVEVWCYTNLHEVELLLNGRSLGTRTMSPLGHAQWSVPWSAGKLEARGRTGDGRLLADSRDTAGAPAALQLIANRQQMQADGVDGCQVNVQVVDAEGRPCPRADNLVTYASTGCSILGVGNGNPNSFEPDRALRRRAFQGRCAAVVQAGTSPGSATVTVTADGLRSAQLVLPLGASSHGPQ